MLLSFILLANANRKHPNEWILLCHKGWILNNKRNSKRARETVKKTRMREKERERENIRMWKEKERERVKKHEWEKNREKERT